MCAVFACTKETFTETCMTLQALAGHVQFIGRTASSSGPRHTAARLLGRLAALCCGDWRLVLWRLARGACDGRRRGSGRASFAHSPSTGTRITKTIQQLFWLIPRGPQPN
jgi:hypothetical protein